MALWNGFTEDNVKIVVKAIELLENRISLHYNSLIDNTELPFRSALYEKKEKETQVLIQIKKFIIDTTDKFVTADGAFIVHVQEQIRSILELYKIELNETMGKVGRLDGLLREEKIIDDIINSEQYINKNKNIYLKYLTKNTHMASTEEMYYHITLVYKSDNDLLYAYQINLSKDEAQQIAYDIDLLKPFIRFEGKRIYPKRVNQYHVYETINKFQKTPYEIHEEYLKGYNGNYNGNEVRFPLPPVDEEESLKKLKITRAFLSASFNDNINSLTSWFINKCESLDIDLIWLKDKYQSQPTEDKIKENIKLCNCFIQLITKEVFEQGKEAGWIGNEIAWARESTPNGHIAIFVEKGCKATGLARVVADNLEFDPNELGMSEEKIEQYLIDLRNRVQK